MYTNIRMNNLLLVSTCVKKTNVCALEEVKAPIWLFVWDFPFMTQ